MGRRLAMTAELSAWLAGLGLSAAATAAEVGAALVAVLDAADPASLEFVGEPGAARRSDPRETADYLYQQLLEEMQAAVAGQTQRLQASVEAFRTAKETAKAMYTAAEAQLRFAAAAQALDPGGDAAERRSDTELWAGLEAARTRLEQVTDDAARTLRELRGQDAAPAGPAAGLLELHADPLGTDIRILLAVEPADTVTLLAALEGPEAISEHGAEAIALASDLLTEIRADGWPADLDSVQADDAAAFVTMFFPADRGSIARRAGVLASTASLRTLRRDARGSVEELAERSGLTADRVAEIEIEGLRSARVYEAIALARALGARLELPGDVGPPLG